MDFLLAGSMLLILVALITFTFRQTIKKPFFKHSPEPIGRISLRNYELIDCNLPLAKFLGFLNPKYCSQYSVEYSVEFLIDPKTSLTKPIDCHITMNGEPFKIVKVLIIKLVENQYMDCIVMTDSDEFDLFSQLPVPMISLDKSMVIMALNASADRIFGNIPKGSHLSMLIAPPLRSRLTNIMFARNRLHKQFALPVPVISAHGEALTQRWEITTMAAMTTGKLILCCLPYKAHTDKKWPLFEKVYPGQSVLWKIDLRDLSFRYSHIGRAWQENFRLPKRTPLSAWLAKVNPQDRERVSQEFSLFHRHLQPQLNCTYRVASTNGIERTITSIGFHSTFESTSGSLIKGRIKGRIEGIHQIVEPNNLMNTHESDYPNAPYVIFSSLCRTMGLRTNWANNESKQHFPAEIEFSNILSSIIRHHPVLKEININMYLPAGEEIEIPIESPIEVRCITCATLIDCEHIAINLIAPETSYPPKHIKQILKYGFYENEILGDEGHEDSDIQRLIHNVGGHLTVQISDGDVKFTLYIPIKIPITDMAKSIKSLTSPIIPIDSDYPKPRILIIDDQEIVLQYLRESMNKEGYQVTAMSNPIEALAHFDAAPMQYDLVITDHNMEGLSGTELIKKMLKIRPDLPIVLCSGQKQETFDSHDLNSKNSGVMIFFRKPLDMQKLSAYLRDHFIRARL